MPPNNANKKFRRWVVRLVVSTLLVHSLPLMAAFDTGASGGLNGLAPHGQLFASDHSDHSASAKLDQSTVHDCFSCFSHCSALMVNPTLSMLSERPIRFFYESHPLVGVSVSALFEPPRSI